MSLQQQVTYLVPDDTAQVARAAFPRGNRYLRLYDARGSLFADRDFAALFPTRGQPAEAPVRLALATILQCMEGLSDRQAADAVRGRIDWKYLLCLALTDPGFDHTVLREFRTRLVAGEPDHAEGPAFAGRAALHRAQVLAAPRVIVTLAAACPADRGARDGMGRPRLTLRRGAVAAGLHDDGDADAAAAGAGLDFPGGLGLGERADHVTLAFLGPQPRYSSGSTGSASRRSRGAFRHPHYTL